MDYETFIAIKSIMAHSLGELARRTETQKKKI